jgi:acetyl esterase/lipase
LFGETFDHIYFGWIPKLKKAASSSVSDFTMATEDMFPGLKVTTTPYKVVNGHEILVGVMVPEKLAPGKRPIIVRFHGGFLVCPQCLMFFSLIACILSVFLQFTGGHAIWFQPWLKEYAKLHSAIVVAADYRLMPEHNGLHMMEDLDDLWDWIFNKLPSFLGGDVEVDLDRILIKGDSAGSFLMSRLSITLTEFVEF